MDKDLVRPERSRWLDLCSGALLYVLATFGLLSLVVPTLIVVVESFDTRSFMAFPPQGFSLDRYIAVFHSEFLIQAAVLSLVCAAITVTIDCALGIPAAIALVRGNSRRKNIISAFLLSPIMLPGIVIGISILMFYSFFGVSASLPLMIVSHVVFTLPFMIRLTMTRMERTDRALEEASANLGANTWKTFRHVLLPQLWPGIIAGGGFSFLNAFDNLDISLFTAPVRQRPLPIELYYLTRFSIDPRVSAIAALEFLMALLLVTLAYKKLGSSGVMRNL
jgi:putative spermidine/putrescine transport system permease protein